MRECGRALWLSIFVGSGDIWRHRSLYVEIVHRAHQAGLAGASVLCTCDGHRTDIIVGYDRLEQDVDPVSRWNSTCSKSAPF